ncbi:MAG: nucleotide-binding protein [Magnetococcales bacterium]|nr:nucleotide-binding protein [Magnetococcales bacterium]MBF0113803.1 nucleotide-binding protein [Magnetococcales bacterium]
MIYNGTEDKSKYISYVDDDVSNSNYNIDYIKDLLQRTLAYQLQCLEYFVECLELIPVREQTEAPSVPPLTPASDTPQPTLLAGAKTKPLSKQVFIVHGHDEKAELQLDKFLREIGLEPIVLHRQPDSGLTIIEKFEKYSDVGYVFILLTPDERAYLCSEENKPDDKREKEWRARPNVIFEFGFFVGKLGRDKVCCLHTGDVTLPSDMSGIIFKNYKNSVNEVAHDIRRELKSLGYMLDG